MGSTRAIKASDAREPLNDLLNEVYREEAWLIIERSGVPTATVVSTRDLRRLEQLDDCRRDGQRVLDAMRAPFQDVDPDEIDSAVYEHYGS